MIPALKYFQMTDDDFKCKCTVDAFPLASFFMDQTPESIALTDDMFLEEIDKHMTKGGLILTL